MNYFIESIDMEQTIFQIDVKLKKILAHISNLEKGYLEFVKNFIKLDELIFSSNLKNFKINLLEEFILSMFSGEGNQHCFENFKALVIRWVKKEKMQEEQMQSIFEKFNPFLESIFPEEQITKNGTFLSKNYLIFKKKIGEGGTAGISIGIDISDIENPLVITLKRFKKSESIEKTLEGRIFSESNFLKNQIHDYISQLIFDGIDKNGNYTQIFKYIDGVDLEQYIKRDPSIYINFDKIKSLFSRILEILIQLQETHRLSHRDLKPSNLYFFFSIFFFFNNINYNKKKKNNRL